MSPIILIAILDSSVLLPMLGIDKMNHQLEKAINRILDKYEIVIPQIVLGEVLSIIYERAKDPEELNRLLRSVDRLRAKMTLNTDRFRPPTNEDMAVANEIHEYFHKIRNADSLIVAQSASIEGATLFTFDRDMVGARLPEKLVQMKKDGRPVHKIKIVNPNEVIRFK